MINRIELAYHFDIAQNTDEWDQIRRGRVGASEAAPLLVKGKGGILGAGAITLCHKVIAEQLGYYDEFEESYTGGAMEAGHEYEPYARTAYERHTFQTVKQVGYISLGAYLGFSPDGLVGERGLLEIKCPQGKEFVRLARTGEIKKEYVSQMQYQMFISDRDWCDHVTYNQFTGEFIIIRVERDEAVMQRFELACAELISIVKESVASIPTQLIKAA